MCTEYSSYFLCCRAVGCEDQGRPFIDHFTGPVYVKNVMFAVIQLIKELKIAIILQNVKLFQTGIIWSVIITSQNSLIIE